MNIARLLLKSARAPAGKVKRKKGKEAAVAMSDRSKVEELDVFMSQLATVSCAATQTPETTLANHSPKKTRFFSANHTEAFCFGSLATHLLMLSRKNIRSNTPVEKDESELTATAAFIWGGTDSLFDILQESLVLHCLCWCVLGHRVVRLSS